MNPGKLLCSCKGFRHIGICTHSIAVNHWTREVDLDTIMKSLDGGKKRKRGGYNAAPRPALIKEGPGKKPTHKKKKKKKLTHREA